MTANSSPPDLLHEPVRVVNVGLEVFSQALLTQGVAVVQVDWTPPAGGDRELTHLIDLLSGRPRSET